MGLVVRLGGRAGGLDHCFEWPVIGANSRFGADQRLHCPKNMQQVAAAVGAFADHNKVWGVAGRTDKRPGAVVQSNTRAIYRQNVIYAVVCERRARGSHLMQFIDQAVDHLIFFGVSAIWRERWHGKALGQFIAQLCN